MGKLRPSRLVTPAALTSRWLEQLPVEHSGQGAEGSLSREDNLFFERMKILGQNDELNSELGPVVVPQEDEEQRQDQEDALAAYRAAVGKIDGDRLKLAEDFSGPFNAYAKTLKSDSYEDKQESAKILNAELRLRAFAVKCPNTGHASFLIVGQGHEPSVGRWQFAHAEGGKTKITASRTYLPVFEIVLESPSEIVQAASIVMSATQDKQQPGIEVR